MFSFIKYFFRAQTKYRIHSPFVFQLMEEVLDDDRYYYAFDLLKYVKRELSLRTDSIEVTDLGAGSKTDKGNIRKISDIAAKAGSTPEKGMLLFRLINFLKPASVIEMGTSLGISTLYQYYASQKIPFYTLEGCPATQAFAKKQFSKYAPKATFQTILGNFDETLPALLKSLDKIDYVLIDGNHRKEPTINYFEMLAAKAHENTVLVFDDIHWSPDMEEAWNHIIADKRVTLSMDVFHYGIVFFRKEQLEKQHFTLIKRKYKPWQTGFLSAKF